MVTRPQARKPVSGRDVRFFSSHECPDWIWGPESLPFNTYERLFPRKKNGN